MAQAWLARSLIPSKLGDPTCGHDVGNTGGQYGKTPRVLGTGVETALGEGPLDELL